MLILPYSMAKINPALSNSADRLNRGGLSAGQVSKIIVIVGPTASGKSDLALRLAKLASTSAKAPADRQGKPFKKKDILGAEIISADSRQVYRHLDIGTGKVPRDGNPKLKTLNSKQTQNHKLKISKKDYYSEGIRHHLIDVVSPKKQFTVDDFKKLGQKAIDDILSRGKIPIIVGGTGFYVDVLLGRMSIAEVPPNKKLRAKLDKQSAEQLFKRLQKLDPERAKTIEPKNKRRLIRALEIVLTTGKPISSPNPSISTKSTNYAIAEFVDKPKVLWLGIKLPKKVLKNRIKKRLDARLKKEMIKEVANLHKKGVSWKRLDGFGLEYRQISRYLASEKFKVKSIKSFEDSEYYRNLLREIIKYSKRQITWFKKNREIKWIKDSKEAKKLVRSFFIT